MLRTPALHVAVVRGDEARVRRELERGVDVNAPDDLGDTPACVAASNGQETILDLLIEAKADLNKAGTLYGWTPAMNAAAKGHEAILAKLIAAGADLTHKGENGANALDCATKNGHNGCVKLLETALASSAGKGQAAGGAGDDGSLEAALAAEKAAREEAEQTIAELRKAVADLKQDIADRDSIIAEQQKVIEDQARAIATATKQ